MITPSGSGEPLPPLYSAWVAELLGGPVPRESRATCDDCAMCAHGGEQREPHKDYFDPAVKCCTYVPRLHNFLAGAILSDNDPAWLPGRATVEKRIEEGVGVTPLGLGPPPVFSLVYDNIANAFGRSRSLRCPHYIEENGGRCGIWLHRESTCATWFCKHVRGSVGYGFWHNSLHQLLTIVENELARWCVLELALENDALRHLISSAGPDTKSDPLSEEAVDSRVDRKSYARAWGNWLGREHEFFISCAQLVNALSWQDALAISGQEARAYARLTKEAYGRLISDETPAALKVGPMQLVQIGRDTTRVSTYSAFDPIDVPNVVMESMHFFDGRPTEDAVKAIADESGIHLDASLVRKLVDFEVLVPPE